MPLSFDELVAPVSSEIGRRQKAGQQSLLHELYGDEARAVLQQRQDMAAARALTDARISSYYNNLSSVNKSDVSKAISSLKDDVEVFVCSRDFENAASAEKILIAAMGHPLPDVRDASVRLLNCIYDGTLWQMPEALKCAVRTVGDDFTLHFNQKEIGDAHHMAVLVHGPGYDLGCEDYVTTIHPLEQDPKTGEVSLQLKPFPRAGYYDWCIVRLPLKADAFCEPSRYYVASMITGQPHKGRFVVHAFSRSENMHEVVVDEQGAVIDTWTGELQRRGRFEDVTTAIPAYQKSGVTSLYVMGVIERDNGGPPQFKRPDTSARAVVDRSSVNRMHGGPVAFQDLVSAAHSNSMKVIVDTYLSVSANGRHRKYPNHLLVRTTDIKTGTEMIHPASDGRENQWRDGVMLNYRKSQVWDLMVHDIVGLTRHGVDGVRFEGGQSAPHIMQTDMVEMKRLDCDGRPHYSSTEVLEGEVVVNSRENGYWTSRASRTYPNPFYVKITRAVWARAPKFVFLAESWWNRDPQLCVSGMIPHSVGLPVTAAKLFGKHLDPNGTVKNQHQSSLNTLRKWSEAYYRALPDSALHIHGTCTHFSPYPALLYGRGTWSVVDLLFFLPGIPLTFMEEAEGKSYRVDTAHAYHQHEEYRRGSMASDAGLDDSFEEEENNSAGMVRVNSWQNFSAELGNAGAMKRIRSINGISTSSMSIDHMEEEHKAAVGPEYGFDLAHINKHYKHRAAVRAKHRVLSEGAFVLLDAHHQHGPHEQVFSFGRFTKEEMLMVATNFSTGASTFHLDTAPLAQAIVSKGGHKLEDVIVEIIDLFDSNKSLAFFSGNEFATAKHYTTVQPYGTLCWEVRILPAAHHEQNFYASCVERLNNALARGHGYESNMIYHQLADSFKDESALQATLEKLYGTVGSANADIFSKCVQRTLYSLTADDLDYQARMFGFLQNLSGFGCGKASDLAQHVVKGNKMGPIVFVTPELGKWSTVGGLGVMVDELSQGLAEYGGEVWVISPYYDRNRKGQSGYLAADDINWIQNMTTYIGEEHVMFGVHQGKVNNVNLIFLHSTQYFPRPYPDADAVYQLKMMILMARGALEALCQLRLIPDMVVTNDWFTGLTAAYAKHGAFGDVFKDTSFFHIVHNLDTTYEGRIYPDSHLNHIHHLSSELLVDPFWSRPVLNPSRCALLCSDSWGTVSPSYRQDLLNSSPLAPLLKNFDKPFAFPNGLPVAARKYKLFTQVGTSHEEAKAKLQQKYFGYTDPKKALFSFVGRITEQKGVHLILEAVPRLVAEHHGNVQVIVGGMANYSDPYSAQCAHRMKELLQHYGGNFWAGPEEFFTDGPTVNLGSDFGLMPSLFEPGGIVQHEFFVASTPVLAFKTGGLKDTVHEYNTETKVGSGFTFEAHTCDDLVMAVGRAMRVFQDASHYRTLRANAGSAVMDLSTVCAAWFGEFKRLRKVLASDVTKKFTKMHTFIYNGDADRVRVCGTFTDWEGKLELTKVSNDSWSVEAEIPSGIHQYKFILGEDDWMFDPKQPHLTEGEHTNNVVAVGLF